MTNRCLFLSARFFIDSNALLVISARAVASPADRVDRRRSDLFPLVRLFSFSFVEKTNVEFQIALSNSSSVDVRKRFRRAEAKTFETPRPKSEENEINSVEMLLRKSSSSSSRAAERENPRQ